MKTAISLLMLALTAVPVAAQTAPKKLAAIKPAPLRLIPPPQYDHPPKGVVTIIRAINQAEVRKLCPISGFNPAIGALACSYPKRAFGCDVVLASDDVITKAGFPPDLVKRHELALCNGWPGDHPGALPFVDWAE